MPNKMNEWIVKARKRLIKEFGGTCQAKDCFETENLEFAHKHGFELNNGRGRGRKERYYAVVKNKNQFLLLCEEHHEQYDKYMITLQSGATVGIEAIV